MSATAADTVEHLMARIALRDHQAFKVLFDQTAGRLLAVASRVLQDRTQAEDVVQDVFVKLWNQAAQRATAQTCTLAWLCVVTRNTALDHLRKKRPETPLQWVDAEGDEHQHDVADEAQQSPMEQLLAHEDGARLGSCLGRLEPEPRQAVLFAFYEGLSHIQIAQRMRKPLGTVKAWTRRSLLRLKGCMEACT
ncbi:MAG: sigma-70 family RNA polymerase sigma factor [Pseudomonadota bacterium]